MKYEVYVEDVSGDIWTDDNDEVPCEAATPWDMFDRLVAWTRDTSIMPRYLFVGAAPPSPNATEAKE